MKESIVNVSSDFSSITELPEKINTAFNSIKSSVSTLKESFATVKDTFNSIKSIPGDVKNVFNDAKETFNSFKTALQQLKNPVKNLGKNFKNMKNIVGKSMSSLKGSLKNSFSAIGKVAKKSFSIVSKAAIKGFAAIGGKSKGAIKLLGSGISKMNLFKQAGSLLGKGFQSVGGAFKFLGTGAGSVLKLLISGVTSFIPVLLTFFSTIIGGIVSIGAAILTTPIGWIMGGIALIIAGAYLLIKFWEPIKQFFASIWDGLVSGFKMVLEFGPWNFFKIWKFYFGCGFSDYRNTYVNYKILGTD